MPLALTGFFTGLALILPIGAQNAFLLRTGLTRRHVTLVTVICMVSDSLLIAAGVAGVGALVSSTPGLVTVVTWLGAAYLVAFGVRSLLAARASSGLVAANEGARGAMAMVWTTMAICWLNPHAYLDILMLGSIANAHGAEGKWLFGVGAIVASVFWFAVLGYGAQLLGRYAHNRRLWQMIDVAIGVLMIGLGVRLVLG
ncbi:LysE/ArgO family amino acid transporter [Dermatophilus congolensis]|uniref:LysE/ArgO family amino acid transporter n=1 Tax=Dermatophilus congolensis TaxID=1863 RepID=UPI001AAF4E22|nr:LysE family transporter [Dermatophilus congolensis]MBO3142094.1 LysE family transporter [Dermatophilus congolensis]MBO3151086.1 LysE family transporter [Dermatophilus congolensis]MBO3161911.1 LysE family transporter [Dermatophilus congolensis]MBO3162369.1 LysE family transporter [Dermatophilus congolensis]MBO3175927.1 LysE family transporter [Dermatophilus congolensis]